MITDSVMKVLQNNAANRANYLMYLNNIDNIYDREFVGSLHEIIRLQISSLTTMLKVLNDRYDYLDGLTYITKIYVEKYVGENDQTEYFVFPQITPNIPDGDKMTFTKPGMWFKNDEDAALAFAITMQANEGGEIIKKYV